MTNQSGEFIPPIITEAKKDSPLSIEKYLPKNYPLLLFQGTSLSNSEKIKTDGLGGGSLSADIIDSLDSRFFRNNDGRMIITTYDPQKFETETFNQYRYFLIKENTGPRRTISYNAIDTDNISHKNLSVETTRYIESKNIASFSFTQNQKSYLGELMMFFHGEYQNKFDTTAIKTMESLYAENGVEPPLKDFEFTGKWLDHDICDSFARRHGFSSVSQLPSEVGYLDYLKKEKVAKILGVDSLEMVDKDNLISLLGDEEQLLDKLTAGFPSGISVDWKNISISETEIIKTIIRQIYQQEIINETERLIKGKPLKQKAIIVPGESVSGYLQAKQDLGV